MGWITVNGTHVFVKEGESASSAMSRVFKKPVGKQTVKTADISSWQKKDIDKLDRNQLVTLSKVVYTKLSNDNEQEAMRIFDNLVTSNSNTALKKYLKNHLEKAKKV